MFARRTALDGYAALRRRFITETESALLIGLLQPEQVPRIPTVECGQGSFPPALAESFWRELLNIDPTDRAVLMGRNLSSLDLPILTQT